MKKKHFLCLVYAIMAIAAIVTVKTLSRQRKDPFTMNLEALARLEIVGHGDCWKLYNACMLKCPGCDRLVYATTGEPGPYRVYNCVCGYHYTNYDI